MKFKVLIPQDITEPGKKYLQENDCEIIVLNECSVENICENVVDCDAILARTFKFPAEVFENAKKLKVIARHGVGYDNIDIEAATSHNVQVCYTPEANAVSVAEHTMALILACAKKVIYMDKETRIGNWEIRNQVRTMNLSGKTLGIIGFGRIGSLVAKKAALGFDMNVIVYRHNPGIYDLPVYVKEVNNIDEIFKKADVVSIHSSLNDETHKMVNMDRLLMMKKSGIFINTARGQEVDEDALYQVLKKGMIAGAGLDVFNDEPASEQNRIFTLDNVTVSPHNAALTQESMDNMGLDAAKGIIEVLNGKPVTWPVNKCLFY